MIALRHNPPARCLPSRPVHLPSQAAQKRGKDLNNVAAAYVGIDLLRAVECFLRDTDTPPSRFGRDAAGDPRIVFDMRNGREPKHKVRLKLLFFINRAYIARAGNGEGR
ncbi:hypothetical protein [Sphingobium phenoxybenzoativorans]|uniref:hypothetical protein n=1 Tax=Sphingobium phenoxybenzoativorans TaxID=1592790 RepID=UPI00209A813B|nr:hypothetical protein [Sphingobium phenoxybenzoativorans]